MKATVGRLILWALPGGNAETALASWISNGVAVSAGQHLLRTSDSRPELVVAQSATVSPSAL
jgi:hypothetical protein